MAILTILRRSDVIHRLTQDRHNASNGVTPRTIPGSTIEDATDMAAITGQKLMLTSQQKAAAGVIKLLSLAITELACAQ